MNNSFHQTTENNIHKMSPGRKKFRIIFTIVCWVVVSFMVSYWFYKYEVEDRDIGVVDYIRLEEPNEHFKVPIASLCFKNPFLPQKLSNIDENINSTMYLKYLEGETFNETYKRIDYNNVTLDLDEYLILTRETLRNESKPRNSSIVPDHKVHFNGFYRDKFLKCFELVSDMESHRDKEELYFYYNVTKLFNDWSQFLTSPERAQEELIYFKIHYPGQFLLGDTPVVYAFPLFSSKVGVYFQVIISDVEVIRRRPTREKICDQNTEGYDSMILTSHIEKNGCRSPYHMSNDSFPLCDTKEKMITSRFDYKSPRVLGIPDACQRISKMKLDGATYYFFPYEPNEMWLFAILYPKEIRIITQSKEVDIHSLIGNIGGYLGLFMGRLIFL